MVKPTELRAQASEFQPQKGESSVSSSNTVTAIPTPVQTPSPNMTAGRETAEQTRERVAADNRGSFSTLTETMNSNQDENTSDRSVSPEGNVEQIAHAAPGGDMINEVTKMVNECAVTPTVNNSTVNANSSIVTHTYGMTAPQNYGPNTTYGGYAPVQTYSPFAAPYTYPVQPYYPTSGTYTNNGATSNPVNLQGQTILSSGSDPISEGRRIYIGNLKFSVDRNGIKRLLRHFNVNNTVEKIYMPYNDVPFDSSHSGVDGRGGPSGDMDHHNSCDPQLGDGELSNKGFVFVTYGNPYEAEEAIRRLSGVMHHDRRLVCRPGLPKGVAFRQPETSTYRGGKRRRGRMLRGDRFDDEYSGQLQVRPASDEYARYGAGEHVYGGYGNGAGNGGYAGGGYAPHASMEPGYCYGGGYGANGPRYSMDSGYRSEGRSSLKTSDRQIYSNASRYHQ